MFDDTGPRRLAVGVVDGSVTLEAGLVQQLILKSDRTVFQCAQLIVKVGINGTSINHLICQCIQLRLVFQIVRIQAYFNAAQQIFNQFGVSADGDALVQRVEVVIVEGQPHR